MMEINAGGKKLIIEDNGDAIANEDMAKEITNEYIESDEAVEDGRKKPIFDIRD